MLKTGKYLQVNKRLSKAFILLIGAVIIVNLRFSVRQIMIYMMFRLDGLT